MGKKGLQLHSIQADINPFSLMAEFIEYKRSYGVTEFTIRSIRSALNNFFAEYKGSIKDYKKLRRGVMLFLTDKSNEYYNKLLQALRQFFDYCIGERLLECNPCDGFKYKRHTNRIVEHSEEVIKALLSIPDRGTFAGLRDYVFMLVILDNGIRPNELLQILIEDIDFANQRLIVREKYSKTNTLRLLPLSLPVINAIKKVIHNRHENWNEDVPVFCTFNGRRMTSHNMQGNFLKYSRKLGVSVTPYHLRHTFALWFVRNGGNLFALQKMMGHTKLDMTRHYVNLAQADLKNSHEKATPINNLFSKKHTVTKIRPKDKRR